MAERDEALGQIYHISGGEETPYRELVYTIADELGLQRPEGKIPVWFAILLARLSFILEKTFNVEPLISMAQVESVRNDMHISGRKLMDHLGFKPKVTWREAIHRTAVWWK